MHSAKGFTLVELVVVVALIALLSSVVLFDGGGSRNRHIVEGVYGVIDLSLTQAVLLRRAQPTDNDGQASTHWVLAADGSSVSIYQDSVSGSGGVYDVADTLREAYPLDARVLLLSCEGLGVNCVPVDEPQVLSWSPGSPIATMRTGQNEVSELYLEANVRDRSVFLKINPLGVVTKE